MMVIDDFPDSVFARPGPRPGQRFDGPQDVSLAFCACQLLASAQRSSSSIISTGASGVAPWAKIGKPPVVHVSGVC
jgi:hypothetical protein